MNSKNTALIFNIQDYAIADGEGIRTVVFFKGCPLRCLWCSNPEGQSYFQEIMFIKHLCKQCGQCIKYCSKNALKAGINDYPVFERETCKNCENRTCIDECTNNAIAIAGNYRDVDSLYKQLKKNSLFYRNSDGGITLSGGEPLSHPEFIAGFLKQCRKTGLSVGVETCGMFDYDKVQCFLDNLKFIYFDIKCIDSEKHKNFTGCSNEVILNNLRSLAGVDSSKIIISLTIVPDYNAEETFIRELAELTVSLNVNKIRLLPYHSLGMAKYEELGRECKVESQLTVDIDVLLQYKAIIENYGINCWIE